MEIKLSNCLILLTQHILIKSFKYFMYKQNSHMYFQPGVKAITIIINDGFLLTFYIFIIMVIFTNLLQSLRY